MKKVQSVEKGKRRATKYHIIFYPPPSSKTPPPTMLGLEAGLKIKLNLVSEVGREGKDQADYSLDDLVIRLVY